MEEKSLFFKEVANQKSLLKDLGALFCNTKIKEGEFKQVVEKINKLKNANIDLLCREPNKPFSGKLLIRLSPEQHRKIFIAATREAESINKWVAHTLENAADHHLPAR